MAKLTYEMSLAAFKAGRKFVNKGNSNTTSTDIVFQLLLFMIYQFQSCSRKNWQHWTMGNKTDKPIIAM